jgi:hypothetical protein
MVAPSEAASLAQMKATLQMQIQQAMMMLKRIEAQEAAQAGQVATPAVQAPAPVAAPAPK